MGISSNAHASECLRCGRTLLPEVMGTKLHG